MQKPLSHYIKKGQTIPVPLFPDFTIPIGHLSTDLPCQALFYYFLVSRYAYESHVLEQHQVYEGELDSGHNFENQIIAVARFYQVEVADMIKYWKLVDDQATLLDLNLLPDENRYRFNKQIVINE